MRAQETAFYQLAGPANKPIHVVPYVGESCKGVGSFCNENKPKSKQEQFDAHDKRNEAVKLRLVLGGDYRDIYLDKHEGAALATAAVSDSDKFLQWLTVERMELFAKDGKVDGGGYNVVLFTHSNFIKSTFGAVKSEISNNAAFFVKLGGDSNVAASGDKFKIVKGTL